MLGDKAYDSSELAEYIEALEAEPVIPSRKNSTHPRDYDRELYKERNQVERLFCRLKHYRRVATRYEKTAASYRAMLHLASAMVWLL